MQHALSYVSDTQDRVWADFLSPAYHPMNQGEKSITRHTTRLVTQQGKRELPMQAF